MDELALQYAGTVSFYKVNVDVANELGQSQEITSLPTLLFYNNGFEVDRVIGAGLGRILTCLHKLML